MRTTFEISVKAINGVILNDPQNIVFDCHKIIGVGVQIVRTFDENSCIVARKLFFFRQGNDLFGTEMVKTMDEFRKYINVVCACCIYECVISYNECALSYNNCFLTYAEKIVTN